MDIKPTLKPVQKRALHELKNLIDNRHVKEIRFLRDHNSRLRKIQNRQQQAITLLCIVLCVGLYYSVILPGFLLPGDKPVLMTHYTNALPASIFWRYHPDI